MVMLDRRRLANPLCIASVPGVAAGASMLEMRKAAEDDIIRVRAR